MLNRDSLDFVINGGRQLSGEITTNTSKNGAMGLMCASLLNKGKTTLRNIPRIEEVFRIIEVMESIGVSIEWINTHDLVIQVPKKLELDNINAESGGRTRSILMFIGPLLHRFKEFSLPHSQGCKLGMRTAAAHIYGFEDLGASIEVTSDQYIVKRNKLQATDVIMFESGDTAVENILLGAALIPGKTTIKFASANYMVQDVCLFLRSCGLKVEGIGSTTITVHGVDEIDADIEHYNSQDPIEAMMWLSAAIVTKSEITIKKAPIEFLELELSKLSKMGFEYEMSEEYKSENKFTRLVDITTKPSHLKTLDEKLYARPFPGINIDNLPFFVPICALAEGESLIHDWVYENRAIYYMDLTKVGADMMLADPHRVIIKGRESFKAAEIVCPPALRPAMIIFIAMLAAPGVSVLRNVYSIQRGYEEIAERLNQLGADVKVLK